MKSDKLRLLVATFGFALYFGVPVHGVLLPSADAAIASSPWGRPGGTVKAEEGSDDSSSDDSGSDDSGSDDSGSDDSSGGEGSSEDDSD
jgi:hypothetical protein